MLQRVIARCGRNAPKQMKAGAKSLSFGCLRYVTSIHDGSTITRLQTRADNPRGHSRSDQKDREVRLGHEIAESSLFHDFAEPGLVNGREEIDEGNRVAMKFI